MIEASRPEDGISRFDSAGFACWATNADKALAARHQKEDGIGRAVLVNGGTRLKVHSLNLCWTIQHNRQAMHPLGQSLKRPGWQMGAVELNRHPIDARMPTTQLHFEISAKAANLHSFFS